MVLREIYKARRRIGGLIRETPLERSHYLSEMCGGEVWLKLENQQLTGSFKIRGAMNKLLQLRGEERRRGVVVASSGNHAQGIGHAARMLGIDAIIVVPSNTPRVKIDAIESYGVELIVHGEEYMEAERMAREMEAEEGKTFVSAYNDSQVIAGQGTIGLEILEADPELDAILVPVGGGGLISGIGCAVKAIDEDIEVLGVQSIASPVMYESIRNGRIVDIEMGESVAEGLHGGIEEGSITFEMCREHVDDFILVKEETIVQAIVDLIRRQRQVVEGAGAVGVAAIMEDRERFRDRRTAVVVSGGNLDFGFVRDALCG
jgi:threonine dehydratase